MHHADDPIRVLHVDDDPGYLDLVATFLEREDDRFSVETRTSASEGLERLAVGDVDCVISDYEMPDNDGVEFLKRVREAYGELPFILFTGRGSEAVASVAISTGVTDYLQKEIGTDQYAILANRVANAVEKVRAERAERRNLDAIESAHEGIGILDRDQRIIYANDAYADLYGYTETELLGERCDVLFPDDVARTVEEEVIPTAYDAGNWRGELTGLRTDGSTFNAEYVVSSTDECGLVFAVWDLSSRNEKKRAIRETKRRLDLALEATDTGVWEWDVNTDEVVWNDALERMMGLDPGTFEGTLEAFFDRIYEEDLARVTDQVERTAENESDHHIEFRMVDANDDVRWFEGHARLVRTESGGERLVGIARDTTERKGQERALRRSQRRFQAVFESSDSFIGILDTDGTLLEVNRTALEFVDAEPRSVVGIPFWKTPWWSHSADLQDDLREWIERAAMGEHVRFEANHRSPRGDVIAVDGVIRPVTDEDETVVSLVAEGRNITELRQKARELEDRNERLETFAGFVSHDLRTPLNVAEGRLQLAREDCHSEHLDDVEWAHEQMRLLIDDLLLLAKEGPMTANVEPVDLDEVTQACWGNVSTADATLERVTARTIRADPSRLRQLLENLVRNAVEHAGAGVTVRVGDLEDGFFVEDDGPGIAGRDLDQIFEMGYTGSADGTGIGLSIVAQIVEAHGWAIDVTEGPDGGARFEVHGVELVDE